MKKITIDLDPTDDPTYGQQQLAFYNSHNGNWCCLPVAGFLQFDKAEVVRHPGREPGDNLRCVVTNLRNSPRSLYEKVYCYRGEIENRIKELLYGLSIDRTSCTKLLANQFRVLMAAASYVLMQELRLKARHTSLHRAQVGTSREEIIRSVGE